MELLILIVVIAAVVGGVKWNHNNADAALEGVEFGVPASTTDVAAAIEAAYCSGLRAKASSVVSRVQVSPRAPGEYDTATKIGDQGEIVVLSGEDGGATVRASVRELYIGSHPMTHWRGYFYGFVAAMAHRLNVVLGIAPSAARMKRFQNGLERRVTSQLSARTTS